MKRRAMNTSQAGTVRSPQRRPAPIRLACSLIALSSVGVIGAASNAAFAAGPLAAGTVPTAANYTGGSGIGTITTATTATGKWTTIQQTQRAAIASFNTFNIAAGSGVTVDQADAGYRLLARIFDNNPTLIQGALQAKGQVYLLNRNGILFDRGAQVNVGALFASSLDIKDADFTKGFDNTNKGANPNAFTRFDLFTDPATGKALPSGPVRVAAGANLNAASNGAIVLIAPAVENNGIITAPDGQVILAAGKTVYLWQRNTDNAADPQAGALRGLMVEITAGDSSINLSDILAANSATNNGTITADRGNVSIAALTVNQKGIVSAGSSVVSNGSVWLTARSVNDPGLAKAMGADADSDASGNANNRTVDQYGTIEFGAGSFTGTPLLTDTMTLSQSDSYSAFKASDGSTHDFRSWIHIVGSRIHSAGTIQAPGGVIDLLGRGAASRILLDSGSVTSAAGDWVDKSVADNIIDIKRLTSNELKDAPLQRSGPLLGAAVSVDARVGSPIFDISGYVANQQQSVQDKATAGGRITIRADQGDFISAAGSTIDVSGGGFRYAGGSYTTTKLIGEDGKLYDVGSASPLIRYVGTTQGITRNYYKAGPMGWNQTQTWESRYQTTPTTESSYVQGANAGSLSVVAPNIVRAGEWLGGATFGRYQVNQTDPTKVPRGGTLTVGLLLDGSVQDALDKKITFNDAAPGLPAGFGMDTALPGALTDSIVLPADEFGFTGLQTETYAYTGFQKLQANANESITVPAGVEVKLPPGGYFDARTSTSAQNPTITLEAAHDGLAAGRISAPAGTISLTAKTVTLGGGQFAADGTQILAGATLDASGMVLADARDAAGLPAAGGFTARAGDSLSDYLIKNVQALTDDMAGATGRPALAVAAPRFAINAGSALNADGTLAGTSINVDEKSNLQIGDGATLAAMGGFALGADNAVTAGNGGKIVLPVRPDTAPAAAKLYGYSLAKGGKLAVDTNSAIRVGDYATGKSGMAIDAATGDLLVASRWFGQGGFSDYTLGSSAQSLAIEPGTQIAPAAEGMQVTLTSLARRPGATSAGLDQLPASGSDLGVGYVIAGGSGSQAVAADLTVREKAAGERTPTSVHFSTSENLRLGSGAEIHADPGATVDFSAVGILDLAGSVWAPGGTIKAKVSGITLQQGSQLFDPSNPDAETQSGLLLVDSGAILSTAATYVSLPAARNAYGSLLAPDGTTTIGPRRQGYVTSGGSISLEAGNARLETRAGSLLDVSAAAATVDLPSNQAGVPYAAQAIWSDAGSISVASTEASRLDGALLGRSAGQGLGGSFTLSFARHAGRDPQTDRADFAHRLVVSQGTRDADPRSVAGTTTPYVTSRIAADAINAGGFANVTLKSDNSIEFSGPVQLATTQSLTVDAPIVDVRATASAPNPAVSLASDHLVLANSQGGNPWAYRSADVTPVPAVATRTGTGTIEGDARLIDLVGSVTVNGVQGGTDAATGREAQGLLLDSSGDIRLTGIAVKQNAASTTAVDALVGGLTSAGNIELRGQQVYPTTLSQFTVASRLVTDANPASPGVGQTVTNAGTVRISQAPGTPQPVLSAGGSATLAGDQVVQAGTLKAPEGNISLSGRSVSLEPGSLTSVSLDGQTVPMGETLDGRTWYYDLVGGGSGTPVTSYSQIYAQTLTSPGSKQIVVGGDSVAVKAGSTVDLSGGGNVQAFEFVAGPGGSKDVLQTSASAPTWAILPSMRLTDAPVDPHLAARNGVAPVASGGGYNTIYISGVMGIADGWYPLLDAHYALLPGAFQVSALTAANKSQLAGAAATTYKNQLAGGGYSNQLAALAKGAYVGSDVPLGQDVPVGRVGMLLDGTTVVSAWRGVAGTDVHEARTSGYIVRPGAVAQQYSQLNVTDGSFFASRASAAGTPAPRLPTDAGGLTLKPNGQLTLEGTLRADPAQGGHAAEVDITADLLAVVAQPGAAATELKLSTELSGLPAGSTFVEVAASSLEGLDGSVLLGGSRSADGTLTTGARRVVVANDSATALSATEVMLAARDQVTVLDGAVIQADQPGVTSRSAYTTSGDGALLRASSDGQLSLTRTATTLVGGNLDVRAGATVTGNSILADATGTNQINGTLLTGKVENGVRSGGALAVAAKSVALGETAGYDARGGVVMDNAKLASLQGLDELALRSYSSIDLVGNANVGSGVLQKLTLDARELAGFQAAGASAPNHAALAASQVTLRNSGASALAGATPTGAGALDIAADRVVLDRGDKGIRGFGQVNVAAGELVQSGKGSTTIAAATSVSTARVVGATNADQTLKAASYDGAAHFALDVSRPATVAVSTLAPTAATAGGRWAFEGKSVDFGSTVDAPAGAITLAARGADSGDGVTVKSGATLNAGGYTRQFTDAAASASAGTVSLSSDSGGVVVQSGAAIDLSAAGDGDAGRLTATATKGTVDLAGSVNGAAASGAQGAVSVDAATIADFSGMNERLNAGGMTGERVFRQRTGDLALASGSAARAQHVSMAADAGNITVDGTIDASGSSGGRVELYAKQNLTLNAGSLVDAHGTGAGTQATDAYSGGGTVELVAENGALNFAGGATVDVSAGAKGDAGSVTFAAARSATGGWVNAPVLAGTVKGQHAAGYSAPQVILRGDRSYDFAADFGAGTDATGTDIPPVFDPSTGMVAYTAPTSANFTATKVFTEYAAFADNAAGIRNPVLTSLNLVLSSGDTAATTVTTAAGIELTGADMTLASALDLTNRPSGANWLRNGVAGVFTLRASGNLDIRNSIGLPDYVGTDSTGIYNVQMDWLPKGRSWSLRLVGGADLAAADPLALQSIGALNGKGSVTIHDDGTGSGIGKVRTGTGSIDIAAGNNFVIGSAAGDQAVVYSAGIGEEPTDPYGRYTSGGGDIRIVAQGDAVGSLKPASQATSAGGEFVNDWLRRTTLYDVAVWPATPVPSSWWAWRPLFREDIASFGGGDIAMNVGGSIANMGVMSPTSGRGSVEPDPFSIPTAVPLTVRGGGNVTVTAGRDIVGGEVLVGLGRGDVRAGGNLGTTAAPTAAFVMGLGSDAARGATSLRMEAGGNAIVQNVSNPTILASTGPDSIGSETYWNDLAIPEYGFGAARAGFFTYAPDSSAEIVAVGGNVSLGRTIAAKPDGSTGRVVSADWSSVAPPKLTLAALTGDIVQPTNALADLNKPIDLYPSAEAAYTVLAGGNIKDLGMRAINMDPSALPSWSAPGKGSETGAPGASDGLPSAVLDYRYAGARIVSDIGASAGPRFVLEAASGDITGATVVAPAAATVRAGRDIVGAYLDIQNLAAGDVSVVAAGRDIVQDASAYHGDGLVKLSNTDATMAPRIYFSGPGAGVVEAGRNVDLMDSKGILADGNTRNSSLHDTTSARLYVLAGVQGPVALGSVNALMAATRLFGIMEDGNSAAMARDARSAIVAADSASPATLDALDAELAGLAALGRTKDIRAAAAAARPALASARATQKDGRNDILDALLAGLRDMSGMDTKDGAAVNAAAAAATRTLAVAALAGNKTGPGEIDLSKTQIQTTGGSGIALLVPGYDASGNAAGVVNVGLPSGAGGNTNIGVVTQTGGAIDAYVTGDFNVNQSKVLTSQGGDIMLYSDSGSIDAGRGALTSRSSSPPRRKAQYDKDGAFTGYVYLPPLDVAGSGIRTVTSDPDGPGPLTAPPPGSVFLFAPKGTINAGEAGIASAGDVTLRAVQVLNANAISAGGSASGVPQASVTPVGALGTTPTPGAKNDDLMKNLPAPSYGTKDDARPRILMVEVLGFGDSEDVRIERKPDEKKCGRESGSGTACNESEM